MDYFIKGPGNHSQHLPIHLPHPSLCSTAFPCSQITPKVAAELHSLFHYFKPIHFSSLKEGTSSAHPPTASTAFILKKESPSFSSSDQTRNSAFPDLDKPPILILPSVFNAYTALSYPLQHLSHAPPNNRDSMKKPWRRSPALSKVLFQTNKNLNTSSSVRDASNSCFSDLSLCISGKPMGHPSSTFTSTFSPSDFPVETSWRPQPSMLPRRRTIVSSPSNANATTHFTISLNQHKPKPAGASSISIPFNEKSARLNHPLGFPRNPSSLTSPTSGSIQTSSSFSTASMSLSSYRSASLEHSKSAEVNGLIPAFQFPFRRSISGISRTSLEKAGPSSCSTTMMQGETLLTFLQLEQEFLISYLLDWVQLYPDQQSVFMPFIDNFHILSSLYQDQVHLHVNGRSGVERDEVKEIYSNPQTWFVTCLIDAYALLKTFPPLFTFKSLFALIHLDETSVLTIKILQQMVNPRLHDPFVKSMLLYLHMAWSLSPLKAPWECALCFLPVLTEKEWYHHLPFQEFEKWKFPTVDHIGVRILEESELRVFLNAPTKPMSKKKKTKKIPTTPLMKSGVSSSVTSLSSLTSYFSATSLTNTTNNNTKGSTSTLNSVTRGKKGIKDGEETITTSIGTTYKQRPKDILEKCAKVLAFMIAHLREIEQPNLFN